MKKRAGKMSWIALWILISMVWLAGCNQEENVNATSTDRHETEQGESNQPETTQPETGETEIPAVREGVPLSEEELNPYRELFGQYQTWYSQALTSLYASPEKIDLRELFYNGILDDPDRYNLTEEEEEFLAPVWAEYSCRLDTTRIPAEKMDEVLNQYFGISLEETEGTGLDTFVYFQEMNCYYNYSGDTNTMRADIHEGYLLEDGTIALYYDIPDYRFENEKGYVVTVRPTEDDLQIVSNLEAD